MEVTKDGAPPQAMVTTSWMREDLSKGHKRFKLYAMHVPLQHRIQEVVRLDVSHPRLAGPSMVIGEATIEVSKLEVAKILQAAVGEMLAKQPPEILQVQAS